LTQIEAGFWTEVARAMSVPHVAVEPEPWFWTQLSRAADFTTIAAIVATVLALIVALRQLDRTERAEEAARREREKVEKEASLRHLMGFLPTLQKIKHEFEIAIREGERSAVERELEEWCDGGSKVRDMLVARPDVPPTVVHNLDTSIALASSAKIQLVDPEVALIPTTERARFAIQTAGAGLAQLLGRLEAFVESTVEEEKEEEESG
jgi:hypothetical protein